MPSGPRQSTETRPTRNDVAKLANISGTTVSRVLSGRPEFQISAEVRERVLQAARELGYAPNAAAKALRSGRSGLIGFWMCLGYSRYRSQVADQMQRILSDHGVTMAVTDADHEYIFEHSLARTLRMPVDGIIAFDAAASVDAFAENQDQWAPNVPFVSMGAYWSERTSFVGVDLKAGAEAAVEHLLETGRQRIAYLAPWNSGLLTAGPRFEGYRDRMAAAGREASPLSVESSTIEAIERALRLRKEAGTMPDAILCMNDDLAMDAAPAIERLGLRVGRDVALIGFNGTEGMDRAACPLTTVAQPIEEMCALAYEFLQAQIEDPTAPLQRRRLKPNLIVRQSSTG